MVLALFSRVRYIHKNPVMRALTCCHRLLFAECRSLRSYTAVYGSVSSQ
jgi:hypothetical protein